jgi:hypothetical protein
MLVPDQHTQCHGWLNRGLSFGWNLTGPSLGPRPRPQRTPSPPAYSLSRSVSDSWYVGCDPTDQSKNQKGSFFWPRLLSRVLAEKAW